MNNCLIIRIICATWLVLNTVQALADDGVCSTAALINPNTIDGGMGGTGAPANGGLGGTGITAQAGGTGGTGIDTEHGGAGGTGAPIELGGLGGTGVMAENTAILPIDMQGGIAMMGVVTGFASICVSNEEVHFEQTTPVYENGQAAKLANLAVGKMVMLKATRAANGRLNAKAIGIFDAVNGPVSRINIGLQSMQVLGQTVRLNQKTLQQLKGIAVGTPVSVSGHRLESGEVLATRIDAAPVTGANAVGANTIGANTMGVVTRVARDGFTVNGTNVNVTDRKLLATIKTGNEVRVSGNWNGNVLQAKRVDLQPTKQLINRADSAILEGFVRAENNDVKLAGTEIRVAEGKARSKDVIKNSGKLVKIELSRDKRGNWVYDKVEPRKGDLFDKGKFENGEQENGAADNSGNNENESSGSNSGGDGSGSGSNSGSGSSSNSGSGSNSNSGSGSSGSSSGLSGHGSSSGPGSSTGSSSSSRSSSGGAVDRTDRSGSSGRTGGSSSSSSSSGSSNAGRSGSGSSGSGSGKNK